VSPNFFIALASILFAIGAVGVTMRRNAIVMFMCIEVMLNAVNLAFIALSRAWNVMDGSISVFFVMVVAAAEAAVGLAIVIAVFRNRGSTNTDDAAELRG
jgi:NADH-quinone oxidoreductase subunit K